MGAIFGIISLKPDASSVTNETLRLMSSCLQHRGQKREAFYLDREIGLGVRLNEAFDILAQPIKDSENSLVLICDGVFFDLSEKGRNLPNAKTECYSEGEILLNLWSSYRLDFLKRLKGMFALALYDKKRNRLLLATDKLATKPIYYIIEKEKLIFASEIKAILNAGINCEVDYRAILDFFIVGFPINGKTFFRRVQRLLPGEMLLVENGKILKIQYHVFNFTKKNFVSNECKARRTLLTLLSKSVEKSLISNLSAGVALSGGLDSSLITAIASKILRNKGKKIVTFSSVFPGYDCDESKYASVVAETVGAEHHEVNHGPEDFAKILSQLIISAEEPYEQIMTHGFALSKLASQYVKILLSGTGGGTLFGGGFYHTQAYIEQCVIERRNLRQCLIPALKAILKGVLNRDLVPLLSLLKLIFPSLGSPLLSAVVCGKDKSIKKHLLSKEVYHKVEGYYPSLIRLHIGKNLEPFAKATYYELMGWMSTLIATADKLNMSCSILAVHPFLDPDLVEYSLSIPHSQKIKDFKKKYVLKKVAEDFLPSEIIWRKKMVFHLPSSLWFRNELQGFLKRILTDSRFKNRGLLNTDFIEGRLIDHIKGKSDWGNFLGRLLSFEVWCREFVDVQWNKTSLETVKTMENLYDS